MLTGDNGLLNRAGQAKENTERVEIIESAKLDILSKITDKKGESLTEDEVEDILTKYGTISNNGESSILEKILTSSKGNYEIAVSEIYNGTLAAEIDTGYGLYNYETGALKKSWSRLLKEGIITVDENGVLSTQYKGWDSTLIKYVNDSSDILDGKLLMSPDVKKISKEAFSGCEKLKETNIPNSVTSLGSYAFRGCTALTNIIIPNSVTSIGYDAFQGCTALTNIIIPNSVTNIGSGAFHGCTALTDLTISNGVKSIGESAFGGCIGLSNITIPSSVESIGRYAFNGCTGLSNITISNGVKSIGESAFYSCINITSIVIPKSVTTIGDSAFSYMENLESVTIEGKVSYTASRVFPQTGGNLKNIVLGSDDVENGMDTIESGCWSSWSPAISNITLKKSITTIKAGAFANLKNITSITIPENVTTIEYPAFYNWTSSQTINVTRYSSSSEATGYASGWNGNATVLWRGQF